MKTKIIEILKKSLHPELLDFIADKLVRLFEEDKNDTIDNILQNLYDDGHITERMAYHSTGRYIKKPQNDKRKIQSSG